MSVVACGILEPPPRDRLVLRDGSVAALRPAVAADYDAVARFYRDLSDESRRRRFMAAGALPDAVIRSLCETSHPARAMTLLALRHFNDGDHVIAACSFAAIDRTTAEVAFAVADRFQGRGIATAMLERLAEIAADQGFHWFQASTLSDNAEMMAVFRDSGFEVRSQSGAGVIDVRLNVAVSPAATLAIDERDRAATVASLRPLLEPDAVAVIGASRRPEAIGRRIYDHLIADRFAGVVYPVNARADEIDGRRCYRSARELPPDVNLAIIAVPAAQVLAAVDECGAAGVRSLVVVSAGFAESGPAGAALQRQLLEKARGYGMRLIGPNCMGIMNTSAAVHLNASFSGTLPRRGRIALASQSGGLGLAVLDIAARRHVGLSTFVSLGNKADVSGNDLLQFGESDPGTSTILLYLESFGNPRRFAQLARRVGRTKPIVVVKAGRTHAGSRAAGSHTAALASRDVAVDALFRQSGVLRADTIDEMFDIAVCLDSQPLPVGTRLAIVSNVGGPAILAADACEAAGLQLPDRQPVDLGAAAGAAEYRQAIEAALGSEDVDALLVTYIPIDPAATEAILAAVGQSVAAGRAAGSRKPVLLCAMNEAAAGHVPFQAGLETVPVFTFPENAVRALGKVAAYARWRAEPPGLPWGFDDVHVDEARDLCRQVLAARGDSWLTPEELHRVLNTFGLPLVPAPAVQSEDEAAAIAALMGYPVAMKVSSPAILHKTEAGAVIVNLTTEGEVRKAFRELAAKAAGTVSPRDAAIVLQPMVGNGVETLIGITVDPLFGPLVAFGLGGVQVEVLRDVAFRIAPLTDRDADALIRSIRGYPLLEGYRGRPAADIEALRDILLRVSLMAAVVPEIKEVDLNPAIALPAGHGCRIVDARIKVGR
jgi:acyl-CoA synthetase (NDP forming)/RimJ/RimL family protein N-acetyltransferase